MSPELDELSAQVSLPLLEQVPLCVKEVGRSPSWVAEEVSLHEEPQLFGEPCSEALVAPLAPP